MDKISGILPANSRITTVDTKEASPVRSGVPSFGRDVVKPSNDRALAKTMVDEVSWMHNRLQEEKQQTQSKSAMASELSEKFFSQKAADQKAEVNNAKAISSEAQAPAVDLNNLSAEPSSEISVGEKGQNVNLYA